MSIDDLKWPAGYCLDPSGKMCAPEEAGPHFDFGYEVGFREAMAIKMRAAARAALAEPQAEPLCPCKDRPASKCPGEWEQGCDLGANEKFAQVYQATPEEEAALKEALSEQQVRTKAVLIVRHRAAALRETNRKKYSGERARTIAMLVRLARKIETET